MVGVPRLCINRGCGDRILQRAYKKHAASLARKIFLYWQVFGKLFTKSGLHTQGVLQNLFLAYHSIEEEFLKSMPELEKLSDRNPKLVMVTTQQFLSLSHAPTKATMERAVMLAVMGKQVVVVNTAETYGGRYEDVQRALTPNYNTGLNGAEYITYQGIDIPFLQFPPGMPDAQMQNYSISMSGN